MKTQETTGKKEVLSDTGMMKRDKSAPTGSSKFYSGSVPSPRYETHSSWVVSGMVLAASGGGGGGGGDWG